MDVVLGFHSKGRVVDAIEIGVEVGVQEGVQKGIVQGERVMEEVS